MTSSSSGLTWVHQLKGKRIGIGPQDSTTEISAQIVLRTLNITEKIPLWKTAESAPGLILFWPVLWTQSMDLPASPSAVSVRWLKRFPVPF